jgi:hypothetical protein
MLELVSGEKAHRNTAASSALEVGFAQNLQVGLPQSNDPQEGARLVRAFLRIADPAIRSAIVHMIEKMGSRLAD